MVRVLVTGAAGFLGFHLMRHLASKRGYQVIGVDNFVRGENDTYLTDLLSNENITFVDGDLSDPATVASLPLDVDYVYHLAALNGTQNFYERPLDVIRSSTLPTIALAEHYGRGGKLKRFVYAGTSESYASTVTRFNWPVPTAEDVPLSISDISNARWSYAISKMHGEVVTAQAGRSFAMPYSVIRYHNAYGPRMGDRHVIPDFYMRAAKNVFTLYGHENTRTFLYVDDAVRGTVMIGESDPCAGEVLNIGSEREVNMLQLAELMMKVAGMEGAIELHPSPEGSVLRRRPDISKLKRLTGFAETTTLEQGLELTSQFYLNGILPPAR